VTFILKWKDYYTNISKINLELESLRLVLVFFLFFII